MCMYYMIPGITLCSISEQWRNCARISATNNVKLQWDNIRSFNIIKEIRKALTGVVRRVVCGVEEGWLNHVVACSRAMGTKHGRDCRVLAPFSIPVYQIQDSTSNYEFSAPLYLPVGPMASCCVHRRNGIRGRWLNFN